MAQDSSGISGWWTVGALYGALAVLLGAFGAHGLEAMAPDPELLVHWKTAAAYHLAHALALLAVAAHPRNPRIAGWLFAVGTAVFSGSLYALVATGVTKLGMITPIGGLALIAGWLALAVASRPRSAAG